MLSTAVQRVVPELSGDHETLDETAESEEALPGQVTLLLMQNEIDRLDELISLARGIGEESKISKLMELIKTRLPLEEPLLLFTEYKATQAAVIAALEASLGAGCAGFINGDERLAVQRSDGSDEVRGPCQIKLPL